MNRGFLRISLAAGICCLPFHLASQGNSPDSIPPLLVTGVEQVIVVDRMIAERAYRNIRDGRPPDHGIDFALLEREIENCRPELEKFDPAYFAVLQETYERMKAYVSNPESDFVRAIQKPGSVEFQGRSPLPPAAFDDPAWQKPEAKPSETRKSKRSIYELEPHLSGKTKKILAKLREMPDSTDSAKEAKRVAIEKEIAVWKKKPSRLESAVMLGILEGIHGQCQPAYLLLPADSDILPAGMTPEMFEDALGK